MSRFHELTIRDLRRETPDAVSLAFDPIPGVDFVPGQYLTLRAMVDGEDLRRSYSICSALGADEWRVAIKRVEGGRFSTWANTMLRVGDRLQVMPPEGRFVLAPQAGMARYYLAFAAGSGITPILSMVTSVLENETASQVTLFYGNRDSASILFAEALGDLKDRFPTRLRLIHLLSRELQDVPLLNGRLDGARVRAMAAAGLFNPDADVALICGPGSMIAEVSAALRELGMAEAAIRTEMFTPAADAKPPAPRSATVTDSNELPVDIIIDGVTRRIGFRPADGNIIDAAARQGVELPWSCKGGMCCTCRCKRQAGEAQMELNFSLEPWEVEAGFMLSCQTMPKGKGLVLDFDAV